jgi:hypothetical protein
MNVNVSIRVGSPGNDAPVTQANTSTATAAPVDPSLIVPVAAELPAGGPNSYGEVGNASGIIQDLAQCSQDGEADCPSAGGSTVASSGRTTAIAPDHSTATAVQQSPSNVSVSIRVASPGTDGLVTQLNGADASAVTSVTTVTHPDNLVVGIVVPGAPESIVIPTDSTTPWNWNWNWTTGSAPPSPESAPTSTPDWVWNWTAPAGAAPVAAPATNDTATVQTGTPGMWTWTWTWTRGDWTTSWTYQQACSCNWNWNWTWVWPDATSTPSAPNAETLPPAPANPEISQSNDSSAAAASITSFDGQQSMTVSSDGGQATQYQGISSLQSAAALADASQVAPLNWSVVTGGVIEGIKQANTILAAASAAAFDTASQRISQHQTGTADGATHTVDAGQVIGTIQSAVADAAVGQAHASNITHVWSATPANQARISRIEQTNEAVAITYATVESLTSQTTDQSQVGAGSDQTAEAHQLALTVQSNTASAHVGQASVRNRVEMEIPWNGLWNPPISQSHTVSAGSVSTSYSTITQTIAQEASGEGIEWDLHAVQTATVKQGGAASSSAAQANLENLAGWTGTLVPPALAGTAGGAAAVQTAGAPTLAGTRAGRLPRRIVPGSVHVAGRSAARVVLMNAPSVASATSHAPASSVAGTATAPAGSRPPTPTERFVHMLFNLLSAGSSALVLLLGAMPFAALLALFMIAALGVGRLQYTMPALGRSVDFARRERPG